MEILLILGAAFLAFSNGANDNFKGFATVWGSDTLSYRHALWIATAATVAGSLVSLVLAQSLVQSFTGRGLVPDAVAASPDFVLSVGIGAAMTVLLATRVGLPVSTTHALIGGLVGAGWAFGGGVHSGTLAGSFLLPLLVSPALAAGMGLLVYRWLRRRPSQMDCACIVAPTRDVMAVAGDASSLRQTAPALVVAEPADCDALGATAARFSITAFADRVHIWSAASICFARGVNDTPKLVALLLTAQVLNTQVSVLIIALIMAAGGLLFSRGVAQTMSLRMSRMDPTQGLSANLITAALVLFASKLGLPVSTTHVSVGAIAGVGAGGGTLNWATVRNILLSWVATLPMAAGGAWVLGSLLWGKADV